MQWTRVRSLVQEDPTCPGATKPVLCNCWARTLEPCSVTRKAATMRSLCTATREQPRLAAARESPHVCSNEDPASQKWMNEWIKKKHKLRFTEVILLPLIQYRIPELWGRRTVFCSSSRQEVEWISSWVWAGLKTCFGQQSVAEVVLCDFQRLGPQADLLGPQRKEAWASLLKDE